MNELSLVCISFCGQSFLRRGSRVWLCTGITHRAFLFPGLALTTRGPDFSVWVLPRHERFSRSSGDSNVQPGLGAFVPHAPVTTCAVSCLGRTFPWDVTWTQEDSSLSLYNMCWADSPSQDMPCCYGIGSGKAVLPFTSALKHVPTHARTRTHVHAHPSPAQMLIF